MKRKYQCPCGRQFDNPHALNAHKHSCKDGHADALARRESSLKLKESRRLPNGMFKCENPECGKEHDGSYGSGRFCSKQCRCSFNAKKCQKYPTKEQLMKRKGFSKKSKQNGWICTTCQQVFRTRAELRKHHIETNHLTEEQNGKGHGWNKGLTVNTSLSVAKSRATYHQHFLEGKFHGSNFGKHHSEETKRKIRQGTIKYLLNVVGSRPRYNKSAIGILEQIAKEHGWNIQHAENGGEFYTGIGYFVDAYDKEKNIVLEYDEPLHYEDAKNNILREKDLKRQREIIEHLHCEYWRYNEATKSLWKVN